MNMAHIQSESLRFNREWLNEGETRTIDFFPAEYVERAEAGWRISGNTGREIDIWI